MRKPFISVATFIFASAALLVAPSALLAGSGNGEQGSTITTSVPVSIDVQSLCSSISVSGGKVDFGSVVPSTKSVVTSFTVAYQCAAGAYPKIAFLSENNCRLVNDHPTNEQAHIRWSISQSEWGGQASTSESLLACSPGSERFIPLPNARTTFTATTQPLMFSDPHVSSAGRFTDKLTLTLEF